MATQLREHTNVEHVQMVKLVNLMSCILCPSTYTHQVPHSTLCVAPQASICCIYFKHQLFCKPEKLERDLLGITVAQECHSNVLESKAGLPQTLIQPPPCSKFRPACSTKLSQSQKKNKQQNLSQGHWAQACVLSSSEREARESEVPSQPQLYLEFEASLGYNRSYCLKRKLNRKCQVILVTYQVQHKSGIHETLSKKALPYPWQTKLPLPHTAVSTVWFLGSYPTYSSILTS